MLQADAWKHHSDCSDSVKPLTIHKIYIIKKKNQLGARQFDEVVENIQHIGNTGKQH